MKIKRFFASSMSEAIAMVREAMGEDAAIISNKRLDNGVEVVAAIGYDDKLLDKANLPPALTNTVARESMPSAQHTPLAKMASARPTASISLAAQEAAKQEALSKRLAERMGRKIPSQTISTGSASKEQLTLTTNNVTGLADPVLASLKEEITTMRHMIEDDLAGLVWQNKQRETPTQAANFTRLRQIGFNAKLAKRYAMASDEDEVGELAFRSILANISAEINTTDNRLLTEGGVYAFVGPTGVGKTTTIAKLAAQYTLRHGPGKVALLTTDSYRIGAFEQLKVFGKLLDAPVRGVDDEVSLRAALRSFESKELILVDTAGMSQRDVKLQEQLSVFATKRLPIKTHLVLSATCQRLVLESALRTFHKANIDAVVVTKLDEGVSLGGVLSLIIDNNLPISYVANGQSIPQDCHLAHAHTLISAAVTMVQQYDELQSEKSLANAFGGKETDVDV